MALKGDFIGFSFNGVHSSDLGIVRTSDGSRYNENLLPTFQDQTVQIPGGDGSYYFGTTYTNRQFSIPIAFDNLSEENFRKLRTVFDGKTMGKLIFDEAPYKYYMVKPTGTPQLKYICFGRTGEPRVYKGEGTINFVAYYPFAKSVETWLNTTLQKKENVNEWKAESKLPLTAPVTSTSDIENTISIYNAGDLPMEWWVYIKKVGTSIKMGQIKCYTGEFPDTIEIGKIEITKDIVLEEEETGILIDSRTCLVSGVKGLTSSFTSNKYGDITTTKNLYNQNISGEFFKIPVPSNNEETVTMEFTGLICNNLCYEYIYY